MEAIIVYRENQRFSISIDHKLSAKILLLLKEALMIPPELSSAMKTNSDYHL